MVQTFVAPQQDASLEIGFEKLIGFSAQHPEIKFSQEAQDRMSQLPDWLIEVTKEKLEEEHPKGKSLTSVSRSLPPSLEERALLEKEMKRLSESFVQSYDGNWNRKFGFVPYLHKSNPLNYLTNIFMHAGLEHLFFNMLCLFIVGIALEDSWGALFYLIFYLLSGFVATATHAFSSPDSKIVCVGASGAIAGLMGAFLVRHFKVRLKVFVLVAVIKIPAYLYMPFMMALDLRNSFRTPDQDVGGVAFWAHIGGYFFGAVSCALVYYSGLEKLLAPKSTKLGISFSTANAVDEAMTHLQQNEPEEALRKLQQRIQAVPNDHQAHIATARVHAYLGDRPTEIATYQRAIHNCILRKEFDAALQVYSALLETYAPEETPQRLPAREWLALCDYLRTRGMLREAAGEYEKVARAYVGESCTAPALASAAECRSHLMEYEYARDLYKVAYDYAVSNPNLQMKIAEELTQVENVLRGQQAA